MNNKELQSRREFFKSAAKAALPMIAAVALANAPAIVKASGVSPSNCGSCQYSCTSCVGQCLDACARSCTSCSNGCARGCHASCYTGCNGKVNRYA